MSSETDTVTKRARLAEHLRKKTQDGAQYFKSGDIAKEIDLELSPNEVGTNLGILGDEIEDLVIEKWGRAASSTTWRVEPSE